MKPIKENKEIKIGGYQTLALRIEEMQKKIMFLEAGRGNRLTEIKERVEELEEQVGKLEEGRENQCRINDELYFICGKKETYKTPLVDENHIRLLNEAVNGKQDDATSPEDRDYIRIDRKVLDEILAVNSNDEEIKYLQHRLRWEMGYR